MVTDNIQSNEIYQEDRFSSLEIEGQVIQQAEFYGCRFKGCTLQEMTFAGCTFEDCQFQDCKLSMLKIPASRFLDCRFSDCELVGVNWTEASLSKSVLKAPFSFERCSLNHSTFIAMRLNGLLMKDCAARDVDLSEADLSRADLRGTDFAESRFANTILDGADLHGAKRYDINPGLNSLKGARFDLPEALSLLYNLDIVLDE